MRAQLVEVPWSPGSVAKVDRWFDLSCGIEGGVPAGLPMPSYGARWWCPAHMRIETITDESLRGRTT